MTELFCGHDNLIRALSPAFHVHGSRMKNLGTLSRLQTSGIGARLRPFQLKIKISTSCAPQKRRVADSSESDGLSSDSEEERFRKYPKKGYEVWEPRVVEFPCYAAKEEEKFFHELFAFPWQRGRTDRFIKRLEKKYFPRHGLDSMLLPAYRNKADESSKGDAVSEKEGFPDDRFHKSMDYPTLARALNTGISSEEKFRSHRSTPSSTKRNLGTDLGSPSFDSTPSIRTIRAPLYRRDGLVDSSGVADDENVIGNPQSDKNHPEVSAGRGLKLNRDSTKLEVDSALQDNDVNTDLPTKPPALKRGTELPEKWNVPGGTVVLIDKPKGWTSFSVCERIRRLVRVKKVGHAGTLDPMATGLLVICVGQATKLADSYQALTKVYTGTLRLGEATSTSDAESPVNERKPWKHITDTDIQNTKEAFLGDLMQIPPMFSALKVQGERLYEKARRGEQLDIPARKISVYEFQIERNNENRQELDFRVCCSKGTYIRSLCADFGRALNSCAHLTRLRREKIGDLSVDDAWDYAELSDTYFKLYQKPPLEL